MAFQRVEGESCVDIPDYDLATRCIGGQQSPFWAEGEDPYNLTAGPDKLSDLMSGLSVPKPYPIVTTTRQPTTIGTVAEVIH
jgi:hypothetical protein